MDGEARHKGRLSSHPHQEVSPPLPSFHNRPTTILFPGSPLRALPRSTRFYENPKIPPDHPEGKTYKYHGLSRRLDTLVPLQGNLGGQHYNNHKLTKSARFYLKPNQVTNFSYPKHTMVRNPMELPHSLGLPNLRIQNQDYPGNGKKATVGFHYTKAVGKNRRHGRLRLPGDPSGKTLFPSTSKTTTLPLCLKGPQFPPAPLVASLTKKLDQVKHYPSNGTPPPHSLPTNHLDRRLSPGMGRIHLGRPKYLRHLVNRGSNSPHKQFGGPGSGKSHPHPAIHSFLNTHCHRQQLHNRGNTKTRIESPQHPETSRAPFQGGSIPKHRPNSHPCPRPPQRRRRLLISDKTSKHRMGTLQDRVQPPVPTRDSTRNRPFCLPNKPQTPSVHGSFSTSQSLFHRRFHDRLEQMENNLPVPTYQSPLQSNLKFNVVPRKGTNNSSMEAHCSLVPSSCTDVLYTRPHRTSLPDRPGGTNKHPIHLLRALGRSDFLRAIFRKNYSFPTAKLLAASYRPSSQRQAEVAWKSFKAWLPSSLLSISQSRVLDFLTYLFNIRKLSPRTIMSYRASLALPLKTGFNINVNSQEFSLLAKAQFIARPPAPKIVPEWSLTTALRSLTSSQFSEPLDSTHNLFKTLFLVALAAGNRVSELAALDRTAVQLLPNRVIIPVKQGFLFKNQTATRNPPNISFPNLPEDKSLCPVLALKHYLLSTQNLPHRGHIFLNPDSGLPLTAGTLSYWMCKAIRLLVPCAKARAHDLRKFSFSLAWTRGLPLDTIVKNAFWSSSNVFIRKYLVIMPDLPPCVAGRSAK